MNFILDVLFLGAFLLGIPALIVVIFPAKKSFLTVFQLQNFSFPTHVIQAIKILALLFFTSFLLSFIATLLEINDLHAVAEIGIVLKSNIPLLVYLFVVQVFAEEWFFRAFLLTQVPRAFSFVNPQIAQGIAVLFSSLLFAFLHTGYQSIIETLGAFILGGILALGFLKTKSFYPSYIAHFLYNAIVFLVFI